MSPERSVTHVSERTFLDLRLQARTSSTHCSENCHMQESLHLGVSGQLLLLGCVVCFQGSKRTFKPLRCGMDVALRNHDAGVSGDFLNSKSVGTCFTQTREHRV